MNKQSAANPARIRLIRLLEQYAFSVLCAAIFPSAHTALPFLPSVLTSYFPMRSKAPHTPSGAFC